MAKRSGLGKRGLDLLIGDSDFQDQERRNAERQMQSGERPSKRRAPAKKKENTETDVSTESDGEMDHEPGPESDLEDNLNADKKVQDLSSTGEEPAPKAEIEIDINRIEPNREQPRRNFDEDSLQELADSIRLHGIIQPLIVQKKDDYYEIIAGERRWRAARLAGLKEVPVVVKEYSDREIMEISLIENIQRQDLNPIEEACAYRRLIDEYALKQDEVAERVSKSRTAITNSLRLLKLDKRVQEMVIGDMLTSGHVRALLSIEDPDLQYQTAQKAFDEKMSVRDVEKYVKKLLSPQPAKKTQDELSEQLQVIYSDMEERMKSSIGTKVSIQPRSSAKGKIQIEYYSAEELERIYHAILNGSSAG